MNNTQGDQQRRRQMVEESIQSLAMEGLTVSEWQLANMELFIAGAIDLPELMTRGVQPESPDGDEGTHD